VKLAALGAPRTEPGLTLFPFLDHPIPAFRSDDGLAAAPACSGRRRGELRLGRRIRAARDHPCKTESKHTKPRYSHLFSYQPVGSQGETQARRPPIAPSKNAS